MLNISSVGIRKYPRVVPWVIWVVGLFPWFHSHSISPHSPLKWKVLDISLGLLTMRRRVRQGTSQGSTPRPWNRPCRHDPYRPYHGPGLDHLDPEEELLTNHRSEPVLVTKLLPHGLGDKTRNGNGKDIANNASMINL